MGRRKAAVRGAAAVTAGILLVLSLSVMVSLALAQNSDSTPPEPPAFPFPLPSPTPILPMGTADQMPDQSHTVTIMNLQTSVTEGDAFSFIVHITPPAPVGGLLVNVDITEGRSHLTGAVVSTLGFGSGESNLFWILETAEDDVVNGNRTVTGTLTDGTGYTVGDPASASVTVLDDDAPPPPPPLPDPDPPLIVSLTWDPEAGTATMTWTVEQGIARYALGWKRQGPYPTSASPTLPASLSSTQSYTATEGLECDRTYEFIIGAQGDGVILAKVWSFTMTTLFTACPPPDQPPVVTARIPDQNLTAGGSAVIIGLTGTFTDPEGQSLRYTASVPNSSVAAIAVNNVAGTLTITPKAAGSVEVTVTASDPGGLSASQRFTVTVAAAPPPTVSFSASSYSVDEGRSLTILVALSRAVGQDLTIPISVTSTSAESGDYSVSGLTNGGLSFTSGYRSASFTIHANEEADCDDETLGLGFGALPTGVRAGSPSTATLQIVDRVCLIIEGLTGAPGPSHGQITLRWSLREGATGYEVQQEKPGLIPFREEWITLPSSALSITTDSTMVEAVISDLEAGKRFKHRVRATKGQVVSGWSKGVTTTALDQSPARPTITEVNDMIGGRGIELKWDAVAGATRYEVRVQDTTPPRIEKTTTFSVELTGLTPRLTYTFTLFAINDHAETASDIRRARVPTPTHWWGHQEDHTVAYQKGSITAAPGLPSGVPDPAAVIAASINSAVTDWETATGMIMGKDLKICEVSACGASNHDRGVVTVKTVSAKTRDTGDPDSNNHNEGCGRSVACVKPGSSSRSDGPGRHMLNMSLIFEEPAWWCRGAVDPMTGSCAQHARVYWTDVQGLDLHPVPRNNGSPPSFYWYVGATMIHEFGHTFGLPDFYNDDTTGLKDLPAVMDNEHDHPTITTEDIEQLRAIYAVHDSASH